MTGESYTVTLPWPDKGLWRNQQMGRHWRFRHKATKTARELAAIVTRTNNIPKMTGAENIAVEVTIIQPNKIRRDKSGMREACKAYIDGISDWIGVDDSKFDDTYSFPGVEKPGRIVFTITPREKSFARMSS